jgi:hypothetical protein
MEIIIIDSAITNATIEASPTTNHLNANSILTDSIDELSGINKKINLNSFLGLEEV